MTDMREKVQQEVEILHDFFERWFMGSADSEEFQLVFVPRISEEMLFIDPDGNHVVGPDLGAGIKRAYGSNSDFRIRVRDVNILYETSDHLLVHYTEWQTGAKRSARSMNGRVSTALLSNASPFRWLHLQETWLPEATQSGGDYSFAND